MSTLSQLKNVDVSLVAKVLAGLEPSAVWHSRGVAGGYRRTFDPRTHQTVVPVELLQKLQTTVYDEPGLRELLGYGGDFSRFAVQGVQVEVRHRNGIVTVLLEENKHLDVFVFLGIPNVFDGSHDAVWKGLQ